MIHSTNEKEFEPTNLGEIEDLNIEDIPLDQIPKSSEIKDYCNEFQDNQTLYDENNQPRTEEEAQAQEKAKKEEEEEAKNDDIVFNQHSKQEETTQSTEESSQNKDELPYEYKFILKYAEKNDFERVQKCLLRYPHSYLARDADGYTPLHRACHSDNVELVKLLIDKGSDVEAKSGEGWRPLHCAAYWGNLNVVNFLIRYGVNINALTNGNNTCLHFAVQRYDRKLLECLLYHPLMNINVKNGSGDTAYDLCKRKNQFYELFHAILNEDAY